MIHYLPSVVEVGRNQALSQQEEKQALAGNSELAMQTYFQLADGGRPSDGMGSQSRML